MKIALYIEEGLEQIVLTPESNTEKGILGKLTDGSRELSIRNGSFYECQGGWVRQRTDDASTMIVLRPTPPAEPDPSKLDGPFDAAAQSAPTQAREGL